MSYQHYQHATDIVGYTYNASMYCPDCIVSAISGRRPNETTEDALARIATMVGIDPMDETTYDSSEFPKVIFRSNLESAETCERCGEELK